ncbi:DUF45 domain-containing protein, partial [Candidatus Peregrinibacteria bacterium]|nr:DUF45 domain-containing protein [Candidatus Peregrinibacteria bacterium]
PYRFNLSRIPRFIHEKSDWLVKNIKQSQSSPKKIKHGDCIKVLGYDHEIKIFPVTATATNKAKARSSKKEKVKLAKSYRTENGKAVFNGYEIQIFTNSNENLTNLLEDFFKKRAKKYFTERADYWSEKMQLNYNRLTLRSQKTRWGSCSRNGNINFNWRLILTTKPILDSVIIHELAHIKHLNHGKQFYTLLETFCPDHKLLTKQLAKWKFPF